MDKKDRIYKVLTQIVGDEKWVSNSPVDCWCYSYDMSFVRPKMPQYVVLPQTVEEIQSIVRLANAEKMPIVPFTGGTNIGGLCIPEQGGIVVDLKRMNKILRIDTESRYAIIEPGVSHAELAQELYKVKARFGWPVGPPSASVLAAAINHGIGGITGRYGLNSQNITSMEVVLPTGETARVGSCAIRADAWHSCLPLPRLDGLFTGWLGTTGIVTKVGIFTPPVPDYVHIGTFSAQNLKDMEKFMRTFSKYEYSDDFTSISWWLSQVPIPYPFIEKPKGAPEWNGYCVMYGFTEKELENKVDTFNKVISGEKKTGSTVDATDVPEESKRGRTQLPSQIVGSTKNYCKMGGGGISWPGTFTPSNRWVQVYDQWKDIYMNKLSPALSPAVRVTMYRGTHYGMLRLMTPFPRDRPAEEANAAHGIIECLKVLLDAGGIPYKPPVAMQREINQRADPGYLDLVVKVKDMLDPNHIMNPGKYQVR
ncbi:MAG TPA: FAD-binding oxidoreductase [Methanofastidiosum sp.]|nr:FAD-binding oxidoreductase [Methanofastidiosum sp.]